MFPNFQCTHYKQQKRMFDLVQKKKKREKEKEGLMGPKELQKFVVTMD